MTSYFRAFKRENDVVELGFTEKKKYNYEKFTGYKVAKNDLENAEFILTIL